MNKTAIKNYAIWARNQLIKNVKQRAFEYGVTEDAIAEVNGDSVSGRILTNVEMNQRQALVKKIDEQGFEQVMEEVAYTWFNRFVALRFMEVNGYLPSHVRVFTNDEGEFKPQILSEALHLDFESLNKDFVFELKNSNDDDVLFRYLLVVQCNELNKVLPGMFQRIEDYTELLLPDHLLNEGSIIGKMISDIPEGDFDVSSENGQIEIIGWLYQYYISEKHDEVIDPLHGKVVKKEDVPAATQLFTTDWVVRYLIDNSVGRYWIERNPSSKLADELTYFVKPKDGRIKTVEEKITPQDITTFDPCVGSGHFLVYAFEVLVKIYVEYGYSERDAAAEIVKNNLYGLDIDGRASQLAYFSVMMKARQYDRRFLSRNIQPHIYEIIESNNIDKSSIDYLCGDDNDLRKNIDALLDTFVDAKEYGSILQVPDVDCNKINEELEKSSDEINMYNMHLNNDFETLIRLAGIMKGKYAVVATNPPYLNKYDAVLKNYINSKYKEYSGDLFSVFMKHNFDVCKEDGYSALMTPNVWMFIKSYEALRNYIISQRGIITLVQMAKGAFFKEATVDVCAFVLSNSNCSTGSYFRLEDFKGDMSVQQEKLIEAIGNQKCDYFYETNGNSFTKIPGAPIAYWVQQSFIDAISTSVTLGNKAYSFQGIITGNNKYFLRLWHEVSSKNMKTNIKNAERKEYDNVWVPYNKGGGFRRWYGNNEYLLRWISQGKSLTRARTENSQYYFQEGVTWSFITSGAFSCRYFPEGALWDVAGSSIFATKNVTIEYICALMNSKVAQLFFDITNPTINYQVMNIVSLPYMKNNCIEKICSISRECIRISKDDWDSFETSWDFHIHPLVKNSLPAAFGNGHHSTHYILMKDVYRAWQKECDERFNQLKSNEEDLNRIFVDIYGLQDELTPEVDDKDVTVRKADLQRDIRSFISYAVGCMMGRYSLDVEGLAYAGGEFDETKYTTFKPDKDAIIPICDDYYFDDDIVGRFVEFVKVVYGEDTLEENLQFIADALGGKGTAREIIRKYFIKDFYKDHLKVYQKRPIYWLFSSGKKNGFKALIYMHRYQPDMLARMRTDYVHEQQERYRTQLQLLEEQAEKAAPSERVKINKQINKLKDQALEIQQYEEKIHHLADQMIEIDLDDGVKVNYAKFQDVLAKI